MYNLQEKYLYDNDPWMEILATTALDLRSTYHIIEYNIPGQLVFGQYMIIPMKHIADWRYIRQHKQPKIEKDGIRENFNQIEYNR